MLTKPYQIKTAKRAVRTIVVAAIVIPFFAPYAAMATEFVSPKGVIELFTSQGCRSCPPADRAFEKLVQQGDVVALSYHVDYWNYLGWADTLARPENTERQYAYSKTFGRNGVYTPQAVVNGQDHLKGTDADDINRRMDAMTEQGEGLTVPVIARRDDGQLAISIGAGTGTANIVVVYFKRHKTVDVLRGENIGQKLNYWHSVSDIQTVGMWDGEPMEIVLPGHIMDQEKHDGCAILLQTSDRDGNPSRILGAAMTTMPMKQM